MSPATELHLTREWHWGIAIVGDPAGTIPDVVTDRLATIGDDTVVLLVRHAQDLDSTNDDADPPGLATATIHARVLHALESHERPISVCDVVLDTPSRTISFGDADDEVTLTGLSSRTRLLASTTHVGATGLDVVWLDLIVMAD